MKKIVLSLLILVLVSCGGASSKNARKKPLYEILTQQKDGGGNIHFFEIISERKELNMLLGDKKLKGKIKPGDINTSNFIILNMGEKTKEGSTIEVVDVQETPDKIIVTIKESEPETNGIATSDYIYPYCIVKINSKKEIEIK